jgi:hypothetical protein
LEFAAALRNQQSEEHCSYAALAANRRDCPEAANSRFFPASLRHFTRKEVIEIDMDEKEIVSR